MKKSVFIGLPCYDGWNPKFGVNLIVALQRCKIPNTLHTLDGESLIPRARNNLAAAFLESDCSHLLFLDTDLEFNPSIIDRFVAHDKDVVGGVYFQKRYDVKIPVFNKLADELPNDDGLAKVRHVGTGMMMIARRAFEKLIETGAAKEFWPCTDERRQEPLHEFFPIGIHGGYYESEDWAFCRMVREAGMDVWLDTHVMAKHWGQGVYPSEPVETLRSSVNHAKALAAKGGNIPADELAEAVGAEVQEACRR